MAEVGIVSYGAYIPKWRVKVSEIGKFWMKNGADLALSLGVPEKAVAGIDEDSLTLAVEASFQAISRINLDPKEIETILVGSESHPYVVKPTSTILGEILGTSNNYLAADLEFACKAGSAGMQLVFGLVAGGFINYGLAVGTDVAQAKPADILECTAASACSSFILGKDSLIAKVLGFSSFSSNTPDFWRRDGQKYPSHSGRFTGEPAYFSHVLGASKALLEKYNMKPSDFDFAIFHMPNGKFPAEAAKKLGFTPTQLEVGFIVSKIGNPYSASSLTGLAATLDQAKPGQKIFMCSYGSGAGSDAFIFETTPLLAKFQKNQTKKVLDYIDSKEYVDYSTMLRISLIKEAE